MNETRKSLGRQNGQLGCLYNIRTESIENLSIFRQNIPVELKRTTDIAETIFNYTFENTFNEKTKIIGVESSLKLSIICGMIDDLDITRNFFNTKIENKNSINGSIIYETRRKLEELEITQIISNEQYKNMISNSILENTNATHFIAGIKWGGNAFANFEYDNKDNLDVKCHLKTILNKIKLVNGVVSGDFDDKETKILNNLNLKFHGDVLINDQKLPSNLESLIELISNFSKYINNVNNGKGVQIVYQLMSLNELNKYLKFNINTNLIIHNINDSLIYNIEQVIENYREQIIKFNDFFNLIKQNENYFDLKIIDEVEEKKMLINKNEIEFKELIREEILKVRINGEKNNLKEILDEETNSAKNIKKFVEERNYLKEKISRINEFKENGKKYIKKIKVDDILNDKLIFLKLNNDFINPKNNNKTNFIENYFDYEYDKNDKLKLFYAKSNNLNLEIKSLNSGYLVTGSNDSTIKIWNIDEGTELKTLEKCLTCFTSLVPLPNGNLASGTDDSKIIIWNIEKGIELKTLRGHYSYIRALVVLPNGILVSGSSDSTIKIWNIDEGIELKTLIIHSIPVNKIVVLPNGNLASGSCDKTIKIWNIDEEKVLKTLEGHSDSVYELCVLSNGNLASGSLDKTIKIWNIDEGIELKTLKGHSSMIISLVPLPNGNLASGSLDSTIKIWNIDEGIELKTLKGHSRELYSLVLLPNGNLASGSSDSTIKIWNIDEGIELKTLKGHYLTVNTLAVLPNCFL